MHRFNFEKRIWRALQAQGEELQQPRIEFEEFVLGVLFQCKRQMSVDRVRSVVGLRICRIEKFPPLRGTLVGSPIVLYSVRENNSNGK